MENHSERRGSSLKSKAVLTIAATAAAGVGFFGADKEAKTVEAVDNTPTPVVTPKKTPVPTETRTPAITATPDIVATAQANLDNVNRQNTADSINREAGYRSGTPRPTATVSPTSTSNPDTVTVPRNTYNEDIDKRAQAILAAQPKPTPVYIDRVIRRDGGNSGILEKFLLIAGGALAFARRQQLKDLITKSGLPNWKITNWVRTHGGSRVARLAPVQFAWRQVRRLYNV